MKEKLYVGPKVRLLREQSALTLEACQMKPDRLLVCDMPGYERGRDSLPVLYLLHGIGGDENEWPRGGTPEVILDNLYADKKLVPMIVVMPNGRASYDDGIPLATRISHFSFRMSTPLAPLEHLIQRVVGHMAEIDRRIQAAEVGGEAAHALELRIEDVQRSFVARPSASAW